MTDNWAANLAGEEEQNGDVVAELKYSPPLYYPQPGVYCFETVVPPAQPFQCCPEYNYVEHKSSPPPAAAPDQPPDDPGYVSCSSSFSEASQENGKQMASANTFDYDWTAGPQTGDQRLRKRITKNEMERNRVHTRGMYIDVLRKIVKDSDLTVNKKPANGRKLTQLEVLMSTRQLIESLKSRSNKS